MRIVLFGPPGVGKGSQASLLTERFGLQHISTGVILRKAIREDTETGRLARKYMTGGRLVPGVVVRSLADDAIAKSGFDNFVLDGYPRTIEQAEWLSEFLTGHDAPLHGVLSLQVPDDVIVDRLSKRRIDTETGVNYHLDFKPPPPDMPPGRIVQRQDDKPEAILQRLKVYRNETAPVEAYYRERGQVKDINGVGQFDEVHDRIAAALREFAVAAQSEDS